jgi:hypothetical protein
MDKSTENRYKSQLEVFIEQLYMRLYNRIL